MDIFLLLVCVCVCVGGGGGGAGGGGWRQCGHTSKRMQALFCHWRVGAWAT